MTATKQALVEKYRKERAKGHLLPLLSDLRTLYFVKQFKQPLKSGTLVKKFLVAGKDRMIHDLTGDVAYLCGLKFSKRHKAYVVPNKDLNPATKLGMILFGDPHPLDKRHRHTDRRRYSVSWSQIIIEV